MEPWRQRLCSAASLVPHLQLDLLRPRNLTGITVQGPVSLDLLQLSSESLHWHNYSDILPPAKSTIHSQDPRLLLQPAGTSAHPAPGGSGRD
ncbi:SCO-spondin [Manis javanica]|nr:SCO-spondin [Manis javanica]